MADITENLKRKHEETDCIARLLKVARMTEADAVKITLGEEDPKSFIVYREFICEKSRFIREKCEELDAGGEKAHIVLQSHTPEHFNIYLDWLYTGSASALQATVVSGMVKCLLTVFGSWVLGSELQDIDWQNQVISVSFRYPIIGARMPRCPEMLAYVVANTTAQSTLRRLVLDHIEARMCKNGLLERWFETWPKELMAELMKRLAARTRTGATGKPQVPNDPSSYSED